jgi:integrase
MSYRKILKQYWRPQFGKRAFLSVGATELRGFIGGTAWKSNKTRNNVVSVGRRLFEFGYSDYPHLTDPASKLKTLRVQRPRPDPFTLGEAETIIAAIREDHGVAMADYFEWQFFTGCRPSETIAVTWADYEGITGTLRIRAARVMGRDKSTTKASVERELELCPRARAVVERQRAATELLPRGYIFARPAGEPGRAVAFLAPHTKQEGLSYWHFVATVKLVEEASGIKFGFADEFKGWPDLAYWNAGDRKAPSKWDLRAGCTAKLPVAGWLEEKSAKERAAMCASSEAIS